MTTTTVNVLVDGVTGKPEARKPLLASCVLATIIFVLTEIMFFTALISSYLVIKAGMGSWAPPETVTIPVAATALNTLILLSSAVLFFIAGRKYKSPNDRLAIKQLYLSATLMGAFFVSSQGYEWVKLVSYGMTMQNSLFGSCFYLLIGSHGLHVLSAVIVLGFFFTKLVQGKLTVDNFKALRIYWYFVVMIWPILYGLVYF
jgi:heme/copper-type cytochrome/quinol oxidase subunit 3